MIGVLNGMAGRKRVLPADERRRLKLFVVPRLGTVTSVPTAWRLMVFAPLAFAGVFIGWQLRGWTQGLSSVIVSTVLVQAVHFCLALAEQPGYIKAGPIEPPVFYWTVGTSIGGLGIGCLFAVGGVGRALLPRS